MRQYESADQIFSRPVLRRILAFAVPSIIQQSTVSIGMMLVQSVVNIFGPDALAGFSAAARIENLIAVIWVSIGNAVSPFTAQNYGARRNDRIPQGYHAALLLDLILPPVCLCFISHVFYRFTHNRYSFLIVFEITCLFRQCGIIHVIRFCTAEVVHQSPDLTVIGPRAVYIEEIICLL